MLAAAMVAIDDGLVVLAGLAGEDVFVDGGVGHAHLLLIRLTLKETGGRRFADDVFRRMQPGQELVNFRHGQVGDGIEVIRAVAPLREIAHVCLAAVAGAGDETALGRADGVEREHAQTRGDVRRRHLVERRDGGDRLHDELLFRREIDRARLDVELLGHGQTVGHVLAEVALGGARHHDADRIVARGLAEDADERAVLAAAVAVDDTFGAAAFEQVADKGDAVFKFFCVISHDFHSVSFVTPGSCPGIQLP